MRQLKLIAFFVMLLLVLTGIPFNPLPELSAATVSAWNQPAAFTRFSYLETSLEEQAMRLKYDWASSNVIDTPLDERGGTAAQVYAQKPLVSSNPAWTWQSPTPPADSISRMYFLNSDEGWMASQSKGLLHTTDGGQTWVSAQFGPPMGFNDVYFSDWKHGWAVGKDSDSWDYKSDPSYSIIWSTSDGGRTWSEQYHKEGSGLGRVTFVDNLTGWALTSDLLLSTLDGGKTWTPAKLPQEFEGYSLSDFQFNDCNTGWLLGNRSQDKTVITIVAYTEDGGQTWSTSTMTNIDHGDMQHLCFVDKSNGWVAGKYGYIWRYDPQNNAWQKQSSPVEAQLFTNLVGIRFLNPIEGWAATENGIILHTIDGGATWVVNALIPRWGLSGLFFSDFLNGWVFGPYGVVYSTTDGGFQWQSLRHGTGSILNSVSFANASQGWAAGAEGTILHTGDAGKTWSQQRSPVSVRLNGIHFVNRLAGWAVGSNGKILNTTDGGKHWNLQNSKSSAEFSSVYFVSAKVGWAVANNGTILNTKDGGATWTPQDAKGNWYLTKVFFYDSLHGWATSAINKAWPVVLRTDDGGVTWTPVEVHPYNPPNPDDVPEGAEINSIHFISALEGWSCGGYGIGSDVLGVILHTTDGGKSWQVQQLKAQNLTTHVFTAIRFIDQKNGFAVGEHGLYYTTTDGGANWNRQVRPCPGVPRVTDLSFVNAKSGYMVGIGGAILHTSTGGR